VFHYTFGSMPPSEDRLKIFEQLLHHLREPILLSTRSGRILSSNVAAAEALETSVAALQVTPLSSYSPDPARLASQLDRVRTGGRGISFPLRSSDGRRFSCEAIEIDDDILLLRLTGGPESGTRERAFNETFSRLQRVADANAETPALESVLRALLTETIGAHGTLAGGVFLVDETGTRLELKSCVGYEDEFVDRFRIIPLEAPLPLTDAFKRADLVLLGTAEDHSSHYPEFTRTHPNIALRGIACVPVQLQGRTIGVIRMAYPLPVTFSEEHRTHLRELSARCADTVDRALIGAADVASDSRDRAADQFTRLHAFTGALAQAISWQEAVEAVVDMGMAATGARSGGLWILSEDGTTVSLVRSVGPTGPTPEKYTDVSLHLPTRMPILDAIRSGHAVWIESCAQMEELYPAMVAAFSQGRESSLACVPLFAQGRCIGGIALNYEGTRRFLEDDRAFLQMLSWYSAQTLERARLYAAEKLARASAESSARRNEFLAAAGTALASSLDLRSSLASIATAAVPQVADWCIVELQDERLEGIPAVVAHRDTAKAQSVLELSQRFRALGDTQGGIPGVIRTGKSELYHSISPKRVRSMRGDPELAELYIKTGLTSAMVVPIVARDRTIGAILLVSARPDRLFDEQDLAMAEDLGRRAGIAVENARLYREAQQADRLKDEFLAMLGHELRNPLAPILTALDLMNLHAGDTFTRERTIIARQVQHVVRLVDDLLDVSRITRGKIHLQKDRVEVSDVIAKSVEMASPLFEQRFQQLTLSVPTAGLTVVGDQARLAQAMANLLTNAAKYTEPKGKIEVSAGVEGGEVCIRVRDSGIGIAPEMLPVLFNLFVQSKGSIDRAQGGLGIGLTIARRLVELHGGTITAHSAGLGHGSQFVVCLPLASENVSESKSPPASSVPAMTESATRWRVLVVDDNKDAAEMLSSALEALGCVTCAAFDAPSALAAAKQFKPELALLDIGLPVMDGYELARQFRSMDITAVTRLVAVTGYGQVSDREKSRAAGFDEHIVKPLELDTVRELLKRLDKRYSQRAGGSGD
jgi:signal transduction histidine kinase/ActR/RegA family two-component response regulator